jgi:hypothetical protein
MLYISVSQTTVADENEDVKELMEIELYVKEPSTWSAATPRPT